MAVVPLFVTGSLVIADFRRSNYRKRGGMLLPLAGEVFWQLPDGEKPYCRGDITEIEYEFTDTRSTP